MHKDDTTRLRHMLDAAREAISFVKARTRADLDIDRKLVLALVKSIEIIGEAAYRMSKAARNQYSDIPWDDIIGMRHRLVHAYFDINLDILWRTVQDDLPPLIAKLERTIPSP
ncbi:MAG: HepT-like ribonuclease domain-containing protein [Acidobacteriota bacterium]|nr:HepT-like ribonuclease domain-containing protein [Acidobacteriota bacterium]